jgi:hypothetical protein
MKKLLKIILCGALMVGAIAYAQTPDLILRVNTDEAYNAYLSNLEQAFQQQVNIGGDDAATMKAHLGLALIQIYRANSSADTLAGNINPLKEEVLSSLFEAMYGSYWSLAPVFRATSQKEFFERLTDFFESGEYPQLRDFVNEQLGIIQSNLYQISAEFNGFLTDMGQFGADFEEHWNYVYEHTASFTFVLKWVDQDETEKLFIFERIFFDRLHQIADLGEQMRADFNAGFSYLDEVMPYYGADIMPGVNDLRSGLQKLIEITEALEVLVANQPLTPLELSIEPLHFVADFAERADTLLAGAEIPIGASVDNKAFVFLKFLQHLPGRGLEEVFKGFYRSGESDGYTFGGIFPRGMPTAWLAMIRSDLIINVNDDFETFKANLDAWATQWSQLDPIPPDKHLGMALVEIVNLLSDEAYFSKIETAFDYLNRGRIDSLVFSFEWSDFDLTDKIDGIRYHLLQYSEASGPTNFVILEKYDDVSTDRYKITADSDFGIQFIGQTQASLFEKGLLTLESAAHMIIAGINNLYQNLDKILVLDLDPSKLNFSHVESDLDLILVLESANPKFLSLTPFGVEQFRAAGEQLKQGFYETMVFFQRLERLFQAIAPYEDDFNISTEEYITATLMGKFMAEAIYNDLADPATTITIKGERVNLSAWFDNPPSSFLQLWKNYVTGVDMRLGGLFPDRPYTAIQQVATLPTRLNLYPAYPNPFNPATQIEFDLPQGAGVKLYIVDLQGRVIEQIMSTNLPAGRYSYTWNAAHLPSGVYLAVLEVNGHQTMRKMTLLK